MAVVGATLPLESQELVDLRALELVAKRRGLDPMGIDARVAQEFGGSPRAAAATSTNSPARAQPWRDPCSRVLALLAVVGMMRRISHHA